MRYYNYLNEKRTSSITEDQFLKLLELNCSDILNKYKQKQNVILRGYLSSIKYGYIDPTKSIRKSQYAINNYYTVLLDELLPSWKNMPKRSKSVICTNNADKSNRYGQTFVVFPYNGSKIGICKNEDIWFSFNIHHNLNELNQFLEFVIQSKYIKKGWDDKETLLKIFDALDEMKKNKESASIIKFATYFYDPFEKSNHKSFLSFLSDEMNPSKNGFENLTTKNYALRDYSNEIWIEGECLLLNEDYWFDSKSNLL